MARALPSTPNTTSGRVNQSRQIHQSRKSINTLIKYIKGRPKPVRANKLAGNPMNRSSVVLHNPLLGAPKKNNRDIVFTTKDGTIKKMDEHGHVLPLLDQYGKLGLEF